MKKGFTLIEILVVIMLIGMITCMESDIFLSSNKIYKKDIKENKYFYYSSEALMFIENEINDHTDHVEVVTNKINIYKTDGRKNVIAFNEAEKKISILYYDKGISKGNNNIVNGVTSFSAEQKGSVVFVSITTIDGKKTERCLKIRVQI